MPESGLLPAMKELPHTRSCFVCGESNPSGLRLRFETDGQIVRTHFVPRADHVGFKQTVHGGLIATLLDEVMVWACAVTTRRFAFCAELSVRFINPLRPGQEAVAEGRLLSSHRNKLFQAGADLKDQAGLVFATATGKYLPIKDAAVLDMATDFVGDRGWLNNSPD